MAVGEEVFGYGFGWPYMPFPWRVARKVGGAMFISSSSWTGFEVAAGSIGGLLGGAVAVATLVFTATASKRAQERERALDLRRTEEHRDAVERRHAREVQEAFDRGWKQRGDIIPNEDDG